MPRISKSLEDTSFLTAALEGLELQKKRIEEQIEQVKQMLGRRTVGSSVAIPRLVRRRQLSGEARRRIALAQKRRWAEYRKMKAAAKQE